MGLNGVREIESFTFAPTAEEQEFMRRQEAAHRLVVFGAARLAMDENNTPRAGAVEDLTWQIEELCSGPDARRFKGVYHRRFMDSDGRPRLSDVELTWNPAGTMGGFGVNREWDGAWASISRLKEEKVATLPLPGGLRATEGLFIDRESGLAMVRRGLWAPNGSRGVHAATKHANATEVQEAADLLNRHIEEGGSKEAAELPTYLEIGYGLDPAAVLGRRRFEDKSYVGVDPGAGNYGGHVDDYSEAVLQQTAESSDTRAGQHISFVLGDGEHLPVRTHSVREVFMSNVLNAPIAAEAKTGMLREAHRVLEKAGNLVIRANWHVEDWPLDAMVRLVRDNGFYAFRSVDTDDVEYGRLEQQYGTPQSVPTPNTGYYLIAES